MGRQIFAWTELEHVKKSPILQVLFPLCDALGLPASRLIARVRAKRKAQR